MTLRAPLLPLPFSVFPEVLGLARIADATLSVGIPSTQSTNPQRDVAALARLVWENPTPLLLDKDAELLFKSGQRQHE